MLSYKSYRRNPKTGRKFVGKYLLCDNIHIGNGSRDRRLTCFIIYRNLNRWNCFCSLQSKGMGLSHGSGIFDIRKQSIIKRKGFIEEELEYDKISRGRYGCSRPFSKKRMQTQISYIFKIIYSGSLQKYCVKKLKQAPSTQDNFTQKSYESAMLEQTTKISEDVLDIISINMQEKTKGYNTTENIKLTATLIGQCC